MSVHQLNVIKHSTYNKMIPFDSENTPYMRNHDINFTRLHVWTGVRHMRGPALNGARFPPKIWKLVRAQSIVGILRPRRIHMCSLKMSRYEGSQAR